MKALFVSLFLLLTINAQNVWYVDKDAPGPIHNGTSWANAWTKFNNSDYWGGNNIGINWGSISAGDTIFVSGGSVSKTYDAADEGAYGIIFRYTGSKSFVDGDPVVVCPGKDAGHNGKVFFTAYGSEQNILNVRNLSNIKITGFYIVDHRTSGQNCVRLGGWQGQSGNDSLIVLDNCYVIDSLCTSVYLSGTRNTIQYCDIEKYPNGSENDMDMITASNGAGGHKVDHCKLIYRNTAVTDAHRDCMQFSSQGQTNRRLTTTISNNLIFAYDAIGTHWNSMFYWYGQMNNDATILYYNNIVVNRKNNTDISGIFVGRYIDSYHITLKILNNTIITKGLSTSTPITNWQLDTLIVKNNLIIVDTTVDKIYNCSNSVGEWNSYVKDIDYNYYTKPDSILLTDLFAVAPLNYTRVLWVSTLGFDTHSYFGKSSNVIFTNKYDTSKTGYYTTTGKDLGEDLSSTYPFLLTDALGNARTGSWDMGALEYQGGQSNNVKVKGKVIFQGPFNPSTGSMLTTLNQNSFLPNSQPYNSPPWNYNGNESFNPGSNASIVDWVLVELRNDSNPSQVVATRAALLNNNGLLFETNGSEGVNFYNVNAGSYYIAIYHRDHLAIMSAAPVQLSSNSALYDFTTAMNKAYGQNPMIELSTGKFGMYGGDGNADGVVDLVDREEVWSTQNGNMGYFSGDFDMNSGVNINDANQLWNVSNGKITQVP